MARDRDYRREHQRRNEIAQSQGWDSAYAKRAAKQNYKDHATFDMRGKWDAWLLENIDRVTKQEEEQAFRTFYGSFLDPDTKKARDRNSFRAKWVVEMTGWGDYDLWDEIYAG